MLTRKFSRALRNGVVVVPFSLRKLPAPGPPIRGFHASAKKYEYCLNRYDSQPRPVVVETIKYATSIARGQRTDESYAQGLLILDECDSVHGEADSKALVELARSTLLFERYNSPPDLEGLKKLQTNDCCITAKVAACEALIGVSLENYQEKAASDFVDPVLHLIAQSRPEIGDGEPYQILEARIKGAKALIDLVSGDLNLAMPLFEEAMKPGAFMGNALLSYAELLHVLRKFSCAKEFYKSVIEGMSAVKDVCEPYNVAACNMSKEEVAIAAYCSLGQLEAHMGNFSDSEELLTRALKETEQHFGPRHPKVGVILTCIALMYRLKGTAERSSSLSAQEELFRKAIELLNAQSLDFEGTCGVIPWKDIIAIARGGYAEALLVQPSRKSEGEELRTWSKKAWMSPWLSLDEALDSAETSPKLPVIDTRLFRVV